MVPNIGWVLYLCDVERLHDDDVEPVGEGEEEERRLHRDGGQEVRTLHLDAVSITSVCQLHFFVFLSLSLNVNTRGEVFFLLFLL